MASWDRDLEALVRTRGPVLVGYAYLLCGDRATAEDLVQDALVRCFTRGRVASRPENIEGYVRRTVLTAYVDGFRRRQRWAALRHLVATDDTDGPRDCEVTARTDVARALALLSPRQRACVVLRFYEDLSLREIAEALTLSLGSVKRYLSDGVHRLEGPLGPLAEAVAEVEDIDDIDEDVVTLISGGCHD